MNASRRPLAVPLLLFLLAAPGRIEAGADEGRNLVRNGGFETVGADAKEPAHFRLRGDAAYTRAGTAAEFTSRGVALDAGRDGDGDGRREGSVAQDVAIGATLPGRWFRFRIRGLPEDGFVLAGDDLHMKAEFFADEGRRALDGVTRKIYPIVEQERRDLAANGVGRRRGAETWKTYAFEFRLPFPEIDQVRLIVGFRGGSGRGPNTVFYVDDVTLEAIPAPADAPDATPIRAAAPARVETSERIPLGGRWSYRPAEGEAVAPKGRGLTITQANADRLFLEVGEGRHLNPFAENMAALLRRGYLDRAGKLVEEDQIRPDNVTITFDATAMIVRARNLPNHPTGQFPSPRGAGDRNPNYIQEQDDTYYLPLEPARNPDAVAMNARNANRALPMGPVGIAINGVVFYNPFDAGMTDATDLMDRCCGHPSPDNRYHYHKYPVCVKSPFADEGQGHSPLIGWAFDGFAIYGPYEADGVMAKDSRENPLNAFNVHQDAVRGWHYHVTPGKFPYILGGYWGQVDRRNLRGPGGPGLAGGRGPGGPDGPPGGGPGRGGPILMALDADHDGALSADEIRKAPEALKDLDRNQDGRLDREELGPPGGDRPGPGPGGRRPGGPGGPPPVPLLPVLDRDGDGMLSAAEIAAAASALAGLDRDRDGRLAIEEIRPPRP